MLQNSPKNIIFALFLTASNKSFSIYSNVKDFVVPCLFYITAILNFLLYIFIKKKLG